MRIPRHRFVALPIIGISLVMSPSSLFALGKKAAPPPAPAAQPAVTRGHEAGEPYGPPVPPEIAGQFHDDPEARRDGWVRQRAYPYSSFSSDAHGRAAEAYVQGRELTRQRDLQGRAAGAAQSPLTPPTGLWNEIGPAPISNSVVGTFGPVAGRATQDTATCPLSG